ncbi:MAG: hypothetical protein AB7K24_09475 [Gemmataceae bacterium]
MIRAISVCGLLLACSLPLVAAPSEDQIWQDLMQDDEAGAKLAYRHVRSLQKTPGYTVDFLKARLKPKPIAVPEGTAKLIRDLDSDNFDVREAAYKELLQQGLAARPALVQELARKPSLEVTNRINQLLSKLEVPVSREVVRVLRCAEILDAVGTPEARALLKELAGGVPGVPLSTQDQKHILELAEKK